MRKNDDHQQFYHGGDLELEHFARGLFGERYFQSCNNTDILYWKKFYIKCFEVLQASACSCVGSIDEFHRKNIDFTISSTIANIKLSRRKDAIHRSTIVGLFKLVFLLLGREEYVSPGNYREFSTFRTINYCQTEKQLCILLKSQVNRHLKSLGFQGSDDANQEFRRWAIAANADHRDDKTYISWIRENFPEFYMQYK